MPASGSTSPPGQFGVLGIEARRDWPPLTVEEARAVLRAFACPAPAQAVTWHGQRPFSATGLIRLDNGDTVFLKRHDSRLRRAAAIDEEHRFLAHLARAGLPVERPLTTPDGGTVITYEGSTYEAFSPLSGTDLYRDIPSWEPYLACSHAHAAGSMLARLHRTAAAYVAPARQNTMLLSSLHTLTAPSLTNAIQSWAETQPGLSQALRGRNWRADITDAAGGFHAALRPHLPALIPCWGHGDWHGSNLFWSTDDSVNVTGVFDFGMSDRTCTPFDLAVAIERGFVHWLDPGDHKTTWLDHLAAFLGGYLAHNPLSRTQKALTLAFLPLVHVEFALSEVAYYDTLVHDPASAEIAYHDYLLGHARWFHSGPGKAFRQDIAALMGAG